jgi:hypothetical protein
VSGDRAHFLPPSAAHDVRSGKKFPQYVHFYEHFPNDFQVIFGSSITSSVIVVFTLNLVFNHWSWRRPKGESAVSVAVREGAVAVDVPDDSLGNQALV